jgi:predicted ATP-grasp superfamily ATP-dependent carboligase
MVLEGSMQGPQLRNAAPKALLADATWYGTLAAVRDLHAHGVAVTIGSDSWFAPARWSRHVSRTVTCPRSKDAEAFLEWLLRFGAQEPGHFLYPTSDEVAWLVASHSNELSRYYRLYAPPMESLIRLLDKARLVEDAKAAGLDVPETVVPRNAADAECCGRTLGFPLFVKPRAQVFRLDFAKGVRVNNTSELVSAWSSQANPKTYAAEVLQHVPDMHLLMLQSLISNSERIYTVDGFVDETGYLSASLACVKILQRPRGTGPGLIFEHAEIDPVIDNGLRLLFRNTGFYGVFDAEFLEVGSRKLLIDINPRYYNHMAFETERGLHLPWMTYLAANGDCEALKVEIAKSKSASMSRCAYVHHLPANLLLSVQRLAGKMSAEDEHHWRRRIEKYGHSVTDPVWTKDDPAPRLVEMGAEIYAAVRHPRSYLRGLLKLPG